MSYRIRTTTISPAVSIAAECCDDLEGAWLVYLAKCEELHRRLEAAGGDAAAGVDLRDDADGLIEHRLFTMRAGVIAEELSLFRRAAGRD